MKAALYLLCMVWGLSLSAQKRFAGQPDFISPGELAIQLTSSYSKDRQKVEAIFRWITDNISYNTKSYGRSRTPVIYEEPDDTARVIKPLTERVAEMVLRRRMGVCDGYARLFKSLCDHAGIRSEIITGYARINWDRNKAKFRSNHKWNAVFIDSSWYLLDPTWASGFISYRGDEFIRDFDARYYLTPPEQFIRDHYPEDLSWTLMANPPVVAEFYYSPLRYSGFLRSGITSYLPEKGVLEVSVGDSIRFEFEANNVTKIYYVSDTLPTEPEPVLFDKMDRLDGFRRADYTYIVTPHSPEWLYVVCDGDVILRYKLNIRKTDNRTAR
jgi:transglutaminase/protease-like cytokinesis protein 3